MAKKKIHLRVITPEERKVDEAVGGIVMRCSTGDLGVLPGHEARSAVLNYGILRILDSGRERRLAVYGGLAVIQNNVLTVLTPEAEWPEDVDLERAQAEREHLERRIREKTDAIELQNDQVLLRRALVQIEIGLSPAAEQEE